MLTFKQNDYDSMLMDDAIFTNYYDGLISHFAVPYNDPSYTKRNFIFEFIESKSVKKMSDPKENSFYIVERNQGVNEKNKWIIQFLNKNKDKKTLIYSQFMERILKHDMLFKHLKKHGYKYLDLKKTDSIDDDKELYFRVYQW